MTNLRAQRIDSRPSLVEITCYGGDPFDFQVHLTVDGQPADVYGWSWAAQIDLDPGLLAWECTGEPDGVSLYLRGSETLRLPTRYCAFDVIGRNPAAGEGRAVLRGFILATSRVTTSLLTGVS